MPSTNGGIQLQHRDLELLHGLFESRIMMLRHIAAIYFDGRKEAAKKRVQRLKKAGLIGERKRSPQEPSVLFMTRKAFDGLRERGMLERYPSMGWTATEKRIRVSKLTLQHELGVMDVKSAFAMAARSRPNMQLAEFSASSILNEFKAIHPTTGARITVKPDGFIRFQESEANVAKKHILFFELDRSTETLEVIVNKVLCYREYYKSGSLALRVGNRHDIYRVPFRLLIVCKSEIRKDNIAKRLLATRPPIRTMVWLTTMAEVLPDPLGKIWVRPAHYEDAIGDTPFRIATPRQLDTYPRKLERNVAVVAEIRKHRLLDIDTL